MRIIRWIVPYVIVLMLPSAMLRAQWVPTSGPEGAYPLAFLNTGSALLVGTDGDGVYRSLDSGLTWTPSNAGWYQQTVYCLHADASGILAGVEGGIHMSTDQGSSWTILNATNIRRPTYALARCGTR